MRTLSERWRRWQFSARSSRILAGKNILRDPLVSQLQTEQTCRATAREKLPCPTHQCRFR